MTDPRNSLELTIQSHPHHHHHHHHHHPHHHHQYHLNCHNHHHHSEHHDIVGREERAQGAAAEIASFLHLQSTFKLYNLPIKKFLVMSWRLLSFIQCRVHQKRVIGGCTGMQRRHCDDICGQKKDILWHARYKTSSIRIALHHKLDQGTFGMSDPPGTSGPPVKNDKKW